MREHLEAIKLFPVLGIIILLCISCTSKQQDSNQCAVSSFNGIVEKEKSSADTLKKETVKSEVLQGDLSAIVKYDERASLKRLTRIPITHIDAYKIRTQQSVYSPDTKKIQLDVINMDGPTAEPGYHRLEQWSNGKWIEFPFIDNLSFSGVGYSLRMGKALPEDIHMYEFKDPWEPNRYKVHFFVYVNMYTYCVLTEDAIFPVEDSILKGAFDFRVLRSTNDSIRILFANHTNLKVQPVFLPSVGTDELYSVHPLARSGADSEYKWMKKHAAIDSGEGILFSIPSSWDISHSQYSTDAKRFMLGRLSPGKYKLGLGIEVYMSTEFIVK